MYGTNFQKEHWPSGKSIGQFQSQVSAIAIVNQDSKTKELFT